ncbi:MAG: DUF4399 domain-containing protein [Gemmatimonadaceae bacterium]
MQRRALTCLAILLLLSNALSAQGAAPAAPAASPQPAPEIYFRAPADGATVGPVFEVAFGLRNYGVAPATVAFGNTGHFHILINAEAPPPGTVIPADSLNRHYGLGQIETMLTLAPGTYTLRLVLGDHDHRVISTALVSRPIRITVRPR